MLVRGNEEDLWSVNGVVTISADLIEEGDKIYYALECESFHLTSFAVLMDVYGITDVMSLSSPHIYVVLVLYTHYPAIYRKYRKMKHLPYLWCLTLDVEYPLYVWQYQLLL